MIKSPIIYYIKGFDILSAEQEKNSLDLLSNEKAKRIKRLVFPKDRSRSLFGLLLLRKIMHDNGNLDFDLKNLVHNKLEKPYILPEHNPNKVDFNISHSGEVVVCACISNALIGIDTEVLQNKQHKLSERFMSAEEMEYIGDSEERFLNLWTQKEALIKVDPKGQLMQLKSIKITPDNKQGSINNRTYNLQSYAIARGTFTHLACSDPIENLEFKRVSQQDITEQL